MAERLDVIIFGATGFTGKYTVKELNRIAKESQPPVTWGIAGRSEEKLRSVLDEIKETTGDDLSQTKIIVADVKDEKSLEKMSAQAKVLINCCGPYRFFGEPVVKACIATKTHHVDVSGEPQYIEQMQLYYNKAAQEAGVYIISACGLDSIPADLGVVYLQKHFDGTVNSVETYLRVTMDSTGGGATFHYGTWESLVYGTNDLGELPGLRAKLYPERLPKFKPKLAALPILHRSPVMDNNWILPFLGSDKSVAERSQRFFFDHDRKRPVQVQTYVCVKSFCTILMMSLIGAIFFPMTKFGLGRKLLLKHPKLFSAGYASHEGPPEEVMQNAKFQITIVGKGWSKDKELAEATDEYTEAPNKTVVVKVSGTNPVYGATCFALVLSAVTILKEANKMPDNGGVLPPGAAFAQTSLVNELQKNGLVFEVMSSTEL